MKKVLWLIVCLMTMVMFTSCGTNYLVSTQYEVCYLDGTRTFDKSATISSYNEKAINVVSHSFGGTNYISVSTSDNPMYGKNPTKLLHLESTTAPMRLKSYNVEKVKKRGNILVKHEELDMGKIIGN